MTESHATQNQPALEDLPDWERDFLAERARVRHWQVTGRGPRGAVVTFGVATRYGEDPLQVAAGRMPGLAALEAAEQPPPGERGGR